MRQTDNLAKLLDFNQPRNSFPGRRIIWLRSRLQSIPFRANFRGPCLCPEETQLPALQPRRRVRGGTGEARRNRSLDAHPSAQRKKVKSCYSPFHTIFDVKSQGRNLLEKY